MSRILIIDDDEPSLDLLVWLLRAAGHQAFGVSNGAEALVLGLCEPPDLVLCDVMLPEMGGCEILRRFRAEPTLSRSRMVAVTALAMPEDRERLLALGFDGYFSKPVVPQTFARDVEALLSGDRLDRPATRAWHSQQRTHDMVGV